MTTAGLHTRIRRLRAAAVEFLGYLRALNYSEHTISAYTVDLAQLEDFLRAGPRPPALGDVTDGSLYSWVRSLADSGLAPASVARKVATVRSFGRWLVERHYVRESPARTLRTPKIHKRLPRVLSREEMRLTLDNLPLSTIAQLRDRMILELLYATGIRLAELVSANVEDVRDGFLRVLGKGGKERLVPVGKMAALAIRAYLEARGTPARGRPLAVNRQGARLSARSVQRIVRRAFTGSGRIGPHTLRHTFATHMLDAGVPLRDIQEFLGHASLSSTQIYTHTSPGRLKRLHEAAHPRGH
jgi:integrase/recombinase XerC